MDLLLVLCLRPWVKTSQGYVGAVLYVLPNGLPLLVWFVTTFNPPFLSCEWWFLFFSDLFCRNGARESLNLLREINVITSAKTRGNLFRDRKPHRG